MRYASLCSGVGSEALAWAPLGWEPVFFAEIEKFPSAVLAERWPQVPNLGDITKIEGKKYDGAIDIIIGGTPCQGFSVAGKRGGLKDKRSGLALHYIRILSGIRPHWFIWENVPGVLSQNKGDDFRTFLAALIEIGYHVAWRMLDTQYVRVDGFGRAIPQRRRRVFVVGNLGDWRNSAKVLFDGESLRGNPPARGKAGQGTARGFEVGPSGGRETEISITLDTKCKDGAIRNQAGMLCYENHAQDSRVKDCGDISPTLSGKAGTGGNNLPLLCMAHETGQGFWTSDDIAGTLRAEGENRPSRPSHLLCMATGQGGTEIKDNHAPTLTCNQEVPIICTQYGDIAGSLTARYDSSPCVDRGQNIIFHGSQDPIFNTETANCLGRNQGAENCVCAPLDLRNAIRSAEKHDNLNRQGAGICSIGDPANTLSSAITHGIITRSVVRRLTPVECERLMGFPDNYTCIPWRGKSAEVCPDGPRYKACGNAYTVNAVRWLGRRIEMTKSIPQIAAEFITSLEER